MRAQAAAVVALPKPSCSDSLAVLTGSNNKIIYLIGTAHISEASVKLVRETIRSFRPSVVMIELDAKRIGKIGDGKKSLQDLGFILPASSTTSPSLAVSQADADAVMPVANSMRTTNSNNPIFGFAAQIAGLAKAAAGAALGTALKSFYASIEKLGFEAGGEFKAAVEEARKVNAKVLLGDRDVDVTLQRLAVALGATDQQQFLRVVDRLNAIEDEMGISSALPGSGGGDISKEQLAKLVENMKRTDTLSALMQALREEVPLIYNAMIGERDVFMANSMGGNMPSDCVMVSVVGAAHMNGIEKCLTSQFGFKLKERVCS